jgi:hypothetical protein
MIKLICTYLVLAFSLLTTFTFLLNKNVKNSVKLIELTGQILIIAFLILQIFKFDLIAEISLITGAIVIMTACILNGKYTFGKINFSHHIVRGAIFAINIFLIIIG